MSTGSFVNNVISGNNQPEPYVGMPATVCFYTDRSPATVVEVIRYKSGKSKGQIRGVMVRGDVAILTSGSEQNGSAQYRYEDGPANAPTSLYLRNRIGRYLRNGTPLSLGRRERYYDPSF
jgi:hypothetical protein